MSIPVSTVPAVKSYLVTAVQAQAVAATEEQLVVLYGAPAAYQPDDIIGVGDVLNRATEPEAMVGSGGAGWLTERYELEVVVNAFRAGDFAVEVDARAWTMAAYVETAVRLDPSCGGLVLEARPTLSRTESLWSDTHKGRIVRLSYSVEVYAAL